MKRVEFTVYGKVIGKGRPRFSSVHGHAMAYTPKATVDYERRIREAYIEQCNGHKFDDVPLEVYISARIKPSKSSSKAKTIDMLAKKIRPTKKPDIDNIIKIILDALNGVAYTDDKNVVYVSAEKRYDVFDSVKVTVKESMIE